MERKNQKTKSVGNGEGSLYYSDSLQKWIYQYYYNGNRKTIKQKNNEKVKDFKARVTKVKSEINAGTFLDNCNYTVYSLGLEMLENKLKRNKVSEASYRREYYSLLQLKTSNIANIKITKINYNQIQAFIDTKCNYSNSYLSKIFQLLQRIFNEALKRNYISKNPMINVEKPKSVQLEKKVEAFSIDEQKKFLEILKNDYYKNIFTIALYSGMRMGEILALQLGDIDLKNNEIHICRTLTKNKEDKTILGKNTKTYNSQRTIPITPLFKSELTDSIKNMKLNINNLIFTQPNGNYYTVSGMNSIFNRICTNANLSVKPYEIKRKKNNETIIINSKRSTYNQHMLRHTYATRMIESGVPAEVLQKLLGHKNIEITINTYTTIFDKYKNEQVDKYVNYINNL
jgi:integrase